MRQLFILLILISTLISCSNSRNKLNENYAGLTTAKQIDSNGLSSTQNSDSIIPASTKNEPESLTAEQIEKVDYNWSTAKTGNPLLHTGFTVKQDSVSAVTGKRIFVKQKPAEIVEITSQKDDDGAKTFILDYYLASKLAYDKFMMQLSINNYTFNNRSNRYEKFMGTYETLYIKPNGQVSNNNELYYSIEYFHSQGKELSTPASVARHAPQGVAN